MYLVQILLPLYDKRGRKIKQSLFAATAAALAEDFGGVTAYTRAPAKGLWRKRSRSMERDDIVVYEVMEKLANRKRWKERQREFECAFNQDKIVVRAIAYISF